VLNKVDADNDFIFCFSDHHKSLQMLEIFFYAMSTELMVPYVRDALEHQQKPNISDFIDSLNTPNEKIMFNIIFFYFNLALYVFRAGVRRNNSEAILASRAVFSPLFFGLNMPFYMETIIRDSMICVQCPSAVREFIEKNESDSVSGNHNKGEGGDFVLENINRKIKSFMPPGLSSDERWTTVCRNIDRLDEVNL
jgi:hypothetical protein